MKRVQYFNLHSYSKLKQDIFDREYVVRRGLRSDFFVVVVVVIVVVVLLVDQEQLSFLVISGRRSDKKDV